MIDIRVGNEFLVRNYKKNIVFFLLMKVFFEKILNNNFLGEKVEKIIKILFWKRFGVEIRCL